MSIEELWRYPVKAMGGESLERAIQREDGIESDRIVHVANAKGRVLTSRSKPKLLGHTGTLGADGKPRVDGLMWMDESVAQDVRLAAGPAPKKPFRDLLFAARLTTRRPQPREARQLLATGIGLTSMVHRATRTAAELRPDELRAGGGAPGTPCACP
jgi:hypothetical protein